MKQMTVVKAIDSARSSSSQDVVDLEVVIPVLNEERRIGATLASLTTYLAEQSWKSRVTVVDNGCTDRTTEAIDRVQTSGVELRIIGCVRRGKGAAVRKGILESASRFVGFCDADLSTPVETIGPAVALMRAGCPVVIGSRRVSGASYVTEQSALRRAGGLAFRSVARGIAPDVADTQCGFKFFDSETARLLFSRSTSAGFAFDVEIIGLARAAGVPVKEIPVMWTDDASSTFRPLTDGHAAFRELWALRARLSATDIRSDHIELSRAA